MGDMADYYLDQAFDPEYEEETDTLYDDGIFFPSRGPHGPGKCPFCGGPTKLKHGKFGDFYGCAAYPDCRGSRSC